ncbi:MAG: hypothetical protein ACR2OR_04595 [Hyphomicrobiales bacterium]
MRWGFGISLFIHTAILLAAVIVLPSPDEYDVENTEAIPVEIVEFEDVSKRVAQAKEAPEDVKTPKNSAVETEIPISQEATNTAEEIAEVKPPEPKEAKVEEVEKTETKPEEAKEKVAAKPTPPKPRHKPKPPKVAKKKHNFNPDDIAALLDKKNYQEEARKKTDGAGTPKKANVNSRGEDLRLSATEVDWLKQKVESCWIKPYGVVNAERLRVTLQFELNIHGEVVGMPEVLATVNHPLAPFAVDSGRRAVLSCQPYDRLDKKKFETWQYIRMNFDLSDMFQS